MDNDTLKSKIDELVTRSSIAQSIFFSEVMEALQEARSLVEGQKLSDTRATESYIAGRFDDYIPTVIGAVQSTSDFPTEVVPTEVYNKVASAVKSEAKSSVYQHIQLPVEMLNLITCCNDTRDNEVDMELLLKRAKRMSSTTVFHEFSTECSMLGSTLYDLCEYNPRDINVISDPDQFYEGTVKPEATGCIVKGNEYQFLRPLFQSVNCRVVREEAIGRLEKAGQLYGTFIQSEKSPSEIQRYYSKIEIIKESFAKFMERKGDEFLELGTEILTERFNTDMEKYSHEDFVDIPRKYETDMILKYLKSGDEDDLDDQMIENHCQILRNIFNEFSSVNLNKLSKSQSTKNSELINLLVPKSKPLIHDDVD